MTSAQRILRYKLTEADFDPAAGVWRCPQIVGTYVTAIRVGGVVVPNRGVYQEDSNGGELRWLGEPGTQPKEVLLEVVDSRSFAPTALTVPPGSRPAKVQSNAGAVKITVALLTVLGGVATAYLTSRGPQASSDRAAPPTAAPAVQPAPSQDLYRVAHIIVQWKGARDSTQTRTKQEAHDRILAAQVELTSGANFANVARKYNDDATRDRGGALGTNAFGKFPSAFDDAVRSLHPGETSPIIETVFGYHIAMRLAL